MPYSGAGTSLSQRSNQRRMCCWFCTRREGAPLRELVVLAREAHHDDRLSLLLEAPEHDLALGDRRAPVLLAVDHHQRRLDPREVRRGRALSVLERVLEGRAPEPERPQQREVARVVHRSPVADATLRHGRPEAVRARDDPVGEQTAAASARDAQPRLVHVAARQHVVHGRHQVVEVVAGVRVLNAIRERLSVGRAAARVHVDDDVSRGRQHAELVEERVAVRRVRSAVNLEHERILLRRIEARRLHDPSLHAAAVEGLAPELLDLAEVRPGHEFLVRPVEHRPPARAHIHHDEVAGRPVPADGQRQSRAVRARGAAHHVVLRPGQVVEAATGEIEPRGARDAVQAVTEQQAAVARERERQRAAAARRVLIARGRLADGEIPSVGEHLRRAQGPRALQQQQVVLVVRARRLGADPADRGDTPFRPLREGRERAGDVGDEDGLRPVARSGEVGRDRAQVVVLERNAEPGFLAPVRQVEDPAAVVRPFRRRLLEPDAAGELAGLAAGERQDPQVIEVLPVREALVVESELRPGDDTGRSMLRLRAPGLIHFRVVSGEKDEARTVGRPCRRVSAAPERGQRARLPRPAAARAPAAGPRLPACA